MEKEITMADPFQTRLDLLDEYEALGGPGTASVVKVRVSVSRQSRNRFKIYGRTGYIGDWRYSSGPIATPREFISCYLECLDACDEFWSSDLDSDLPALIEFAPEFFAEVQRLWDSDDWQADESEESSSGQA